MNTDTGQYTLRRGEHSFGPYSLGELSAYLATGNVVPGDAIFDHATQQWTTAGSLLQQHGVTPPAAVIPPPVSMPSGADPSGMNPGAPPAAGEVAPGSRRGLAIASLVTGLLALSCCGPFSGVAAIVTGTMAMKDPVNRGMGIAGLVLGIVGTVLGTLGIILQLLMSAFP